MSAVIYTADLADGWKPGTPLDPRSAEYLEDNAGDCDWCPVCHKRHLILTDDEETSQNVRLVASRCNLDESGCGGTWIELWELKGIVCVTTLAEHEQAGAAE